MSNVTDGWYWPGPPAPIPPEMRTVLGDGFCDMLLEEWVPIEPSLIVDREHPGTARTMFQFVDRPEEPPDSEEVP